MLMFRLLSRRLRCTFPVAYRSVSSGYGIIKSDLPDVQISNESVPDLVFNHFSKWDDALIAECAVTGRKYTYKQIMDYSLALNKSLRKKLKLQSGDIVAVLLPNVPEMPIATLGIFKAGLVVTTINPLYTPGESILNEQIKGKLLFKKN
ncbi:hypothetical protein HUJ04_010582 [Dendroctonus ponderosae]